MTDIAQTDVSSASQVREELVAAINSLALVAELRPSRQ